MRSDRILLSAAAGVLLAVALAGCVQVPSQRNSSQIPAAPEPYQDPVVELLDYAHELSEASPKQRTEHVLEARDAVDAAPGGWSYARLALAYGTPGQQRYTPDEAARYAELALTTDDAHWSEPARQYLSDYARMYKTLVRRSESARTASAPDAGSDPLDNQNTGAAQARIVELEKQLREARRKLRELANIEDRLTTGTDTP